MSMEESTRANAMDNLSYQEAFLVQLKDQQKRYKELYPDKEDIFESVVKSQQTLVDVLRARK